MLKKTSSVAIITVILLGGLSGFFIFEPEPAAAYTKRDSILIIGNENFTTANGVVGGNGTEEDPYVISGWQINETTGIPIEIRNTTDYFVIRNVTVKTQAFFEMKLHNVTNGTITDLKTYAYYLRINLNNSHFNRIIDNNLSNSFYIKLEYSSNNIIQNNDISSGNADITLDHSSNNTLRSNRYAQTYNGVFLYYSENNEIANNTIFAWDSGTGIHMAFSPNNNISGNEIIDCRDGILLEESNNVTILNNHIEENYNIGIDIDSGCHDTFLYGNDIFRNSDGVVTEHSDRLRFYNNNISYNYAYGLSVTFSKDNIIINNTILSHPWSGMFLRVVFNTSIKRNRIQNNEEGIMSYVSDENLIENNAIENNDYGIDFRGSNNNTFTDNEIISNSYFGISFQDTSTNNKLQWNYLAGNRQGIYISASNGQNMSFNRIFDNYNAGIAIESSSYCTVYQNEIFNNMVGIYNYWYSNSNRIIQNTLRNSTDYGIDISFSDDIEVNDNKIFNCDIPLNLYYAVYISVQRNEMYGGGIIITENLESWVNLSIGTSNRVNGKPVYYWIDKNELTVPKGAGQIFLINCSNISVEGQAIEKATIALNLVGSKECRVINNKFSYNSHYGMIIFHSENNIIENNEVDSNDYDGIQLYDSDYNIVRFNKAVSNFGNGISIQHSNYNNVNNNTCTNNFDAGISVSSSFKNNYTHNQLISNSDYGFDLDYVKTSNFFNNKITQNNKSGIYFTYVEFCEFFSNDIYDNGEYGIQIRRGGHNELYNNTITSNPTGVYLYNSDFNVLYENYIKKNPYGINLENSEYNQIYHNTFMGNVNPTDFTGEAKNHWNLPYPRGGNFWDDYNGDDYYQGPDQDIKGRNGIGDGIGDDEKTLWTNNTDFYPLMQPWGGLPSAPDNIELEFGCGFIHLTWHIPTQANNFPVTNISIFRGTNYDNVTYYGSIGASDGYNDTDVENGVRYYYQLSSFNIVGESKKSLILDAMPGLRPTAPQDLVITESNDFLALLWDKPAYDGCMPVTNYNIYKGIASGALQVYKTIGNTEYFIDEEISKGVTYYYQVSAVNAIGEGPRSNEASFVFATLPWAPFNVSAEAGDRFVKLSWEPPLSDGGLPVENYYVYRNGSAGLYETIAKIDENEFIYIDTDVDNGIRYGYKLRAKNKLGKGEFSDAVFATPQKPPKSDNKSPKAQISASNTTGPPPLNVNFFGSGFDPDGTIRSYIWDFGDGNKSFEQNPMHTYFQTGIYYVKLTVIDDEGASGQSRITIIVKEDSAPPAETDAGPEQEKKGDTTWLVASVSGIIVGLIIIVILLFAWQKAGRKEHIVVEKQRIKREPVVYRSLKRIKTVEAQEFYEDELEE